MQNTSSLSTLPRPLCLGVVAPDRFLSMSQIELNCILMLNWITLNRTALKIKMRTNAELFEMELFLYAKLNCLKLKCFWHWNSIYAPAPNSTTSTGQGDISTSSTGCIRFFRLFIQVHLLIDGSVEDQYATQLFDSTDTALTWKHSRFVLSERLYVILESSQIICMCVCVCVDYWDDGCFNFNHKTRKVVYTFVRPFHQIWHIWKGDVKINTDMWALLSDCYCKEDTL